MEIVNEIFEEEYLQILKTYHQYYTRGFDNFAYKFWKNRKRYTYDFVNFVYCKPPRKLALHTQIGAIVLETNRKYEKILFSCKTDAVATPLGRAYEDGLYIRTKLKTWFVV